MEGGKSRKYLSNYPLLFALEKRCGFNSRRNASDLNKTSQLILAMFELKRDRFSVIPQLDRLISHLEPEITLTRSTRVYALTKFRSSTLFNSSFTAN